MIKAVIFDYGGVLTKRSFADTFCNNIAKQFNLKPENVKDAFEKNNHSYLISKISGKEFFERFAKSIGVDKPPNFFIKKFLNSEEPRGEAYKIVKKLKGKYKLCLLSDNYSEFVEMIEKEHHLKELFDVLVFSSREEVEKPDKRIFMITLQRLGVKPEECVYTDDKEDNVRAGQDVGMESLLFTSADKLKIGLIKRGIRGL